MCKMNQQRKSCSSKCNLGMSWISMHSTERTRPEPTESEKKENKPNAAKILRAEKFDVSQQNKKKCRRKTIFLETNQKNLAEENESGMPFILYAVLFSVFPKKISFISLFIFSCPKCFHQPWIHYRNFILGQKNNFDREIWNLISNRRSCLYYNDFSAYEVTH